jgi:predicted ABC-type ATPase
MYCFSRRKPYRRNFPTSSPHGPVPSSCLPIWLEAPEPDAGSTARRRGCGPERLSAFRPELVAISAGRIMLARMRELAAGGADFAFETTLASRSFAPWLVRLQSRGYHVHLLFLWLSSADLAVDRVAERVRLGGHAVPEMVVRRRYRAGLNNFLRLYAPLADSWQLFDNSGARPRPVAGGGRSVADSVADADVWQRLKESFE